MRVTYRYTYQGNVGADYIEMSVGELSTSSFITMVDNPTAVPAGDVRAAVINVTVPADPLDPTVYHVHMASGFDLSGVPFCVILPD